MSKGSTNIVQQTAPQQAESLHDAFFSQIELPVKSSERLDFNGQSKYEVSEEAFANMQAFDEDKKQLCCCKPNVSHDESLKFILKASPEYLNLAPFENKPAGKVIEENAFTRKVTNIYFNQNQVYYRNEVIQKIISRISSPQCKVLEVFG